MTYFVFFETEDDYGRFRRTVGFTTEALRDAWVSEELRLLALRPGDGLSDLEEWEAPHSEWSHVSILA